MMNNWTDETCAYVYFTYYHSEHEVIILPEFPSLIILPLFMLAVLVVIIHKKKNGVEWKTGDKTI